MKSIAKYAAIGTLARFTKEQLKSEIKRRQDLERARRHLPAAERQLERCKERVEKYRALIAEFGTGED